MFVSCYFGRCSGAQSVVRWSFSLGSCSALRGGLQSLRAVMQTGDQREGKESIAGETAHGGAAEGSSFLQMGASLEQQVLSMFKIMEEYDWAEFAVITSLLPGYDTFVDIVQTYTDTSYFLWNVQDVLSLEMSVGASEAKTKRVLQQLDAQVLLAYCSYDEAQFLFRQAAEVACLAVGNPNSPPPDSFPVGVIGVISDQWRKSLRQRVREGVAIVANGADGFKRQYGFIPEGHGDCSKPATHSDNNTLFRHMLNVTWERKDLSFNSQGFLSNPSMVIIALDRERIWDKFWQDRRAALMALSSKVLPAQGPSGGPHQPDQNHTISRSVSHYWFFLSCVPSCCLRRSRETRSTSSLGPKTQTS
ncbi:Glutamate receptor ionotropic, NMDA 2C [Takifugu flavidus]|uniref:Glutamate receptor ionotropic, NMDA 2C n=1 Tax=Takifugu flavidus TaxID=433684 RepID=A0A5C6PRW5_9TELE|nr:Glutamate receptor ionotropic, NMDA 2C [Takifugu flavidus]